MDDTTVVGLISGISPKVQNYPLPYQSTIQSVFTYSIRAWYAGSSAGAKKKSLQRVINSAQKIIGCPLPSLEEICVNSVKCKDPQTFF